MAMVNRNGKLAPCNPHETAAAGMRISLDEPWLHLDLGRDRRLLSFAPHRPGFTTARRVIWRQVRDADLTPDLDAEAWLSAELAALGRADCVAMLTSCRLDRFVTAQSGPVFCVATVGLGNAERVGSRRAVPAGGHGTVNIAVLAETGLSDPAMIEALTIIAEARTTAILEARMMLPAGHATGTGTDCIALAADPGTARHAGTHTELGAHLGRAVHDAVRRGALDWMAAHWPGGAAPS